MSDHQPLVRWPEAELPYLRRVERLRLLAYAPHQAASRAGDLVDAAAVPAPAPAPAPGGPPAHAMADYLLWAAALTAVQHEVALLLPLPDEDLQHLTQALGAPPPVPLHTLRWGRSSHWQHLLDAMLARLAPRPAMRGEPVQRVLALLRAASPAQRNAWADALLADMAGAAPQTELPDAGVAQLLWSALGVYWRQLAVALGRQLPAGAVADAGEHRHQCPVCGQSPVGSLVLDGSQSGGSRYLQCSLCETQWHGVRAKCTNCDGSGALDYWSLDRDAADPSGTVHPAAIQAETCGDCHGYLKAFYLQADPQLELVADDLASLALDSEMADMGLGRTGLNPLLLPSG